MYQIRLRVGEAGLSVVSRSVYYSIDGKAYEIIAPAASGHVVINVPKGSRVDCVAMRDATVSQKSFLRFCPDLEKFTPDGAFLPVRPGSIVVEQITEVADDIGMTGAVVDANVFLGGSHTERLEQAVETLNGRLTHAYYLLQAIEARLLKLESLESIRQLLGESCSASSDMPAPDSESAVEPDRAGTHPETPSVDSLPAENTTDNQQALEAVIEPNPPRQA